MAARRPYAGYGSAKPPAMAPSQRAPLPPPPDGQAPIRLPIGGDQSTDPSMQAPQGDDAQVMALLQKLGIR